MARPIPYIDLRELSKTPQQEKPKRNTFEKTVRNLAKNKSSKDLALGTLSGWVAGVAFTKIGKIAAFGLGGGILLLHYASEWGYVHVNWDRVREATGHSQQLLDALVNFVKKNTCFSFGFAGGFFFGIAST